MKILIVGGGRWAQVYVDNILSLNTVISSLGITIFTKSNSKELDRKYQQFNCIQVTDQKLDVIQKSYDLGVIATHPDSHYMDASYYIHHVESMIIEKPCFSSVMQFSDFDALIKKFSYSSKKIIVSCPFLFTEVVLKVIKQSKENALKKVSLHWHDPEEHPKGYFYDSAVSETAIGHFFPIALAIVSSENAPVVKLHKGIKGVTGTVYSYGKVTNVQIEYRRHASVKRKREIKLEDLNGNVEVYDLDKNIDLKSGIRWDNIHQRISPLSSQVLYALYDIDIFQQYISFMSHSRTSYLYQPL